MKTFIKGLTLGMAATVGMLSAQVSDAEKTMVQAVVPGTQIQKVEKGEIDGLYKAFMDNGRILNIYPFTQKIIFGDIYTASGQNLSDADRRSWQAELSTKKLGTIRYDEVKKVSLGVDYNGGSSKYSIVMITDPQCPFCKKAEDFLSTKKSSIEYVYSVAVPSHTQAPAMIETILASKDSKETILKYAKNQAVDSIKSDKAKKRYGEMDGYAKKLGVNGTPMFVVIDKTTKNPIQFIEGANLNELQKYVD